MLTLQFERFSNTLLEVADKSVMSVKHSSIILKNNKIVCSGFNSMLGNKSRHAECSAVISYLKIKNILLNDWELDCLEKQCFL